MKKTILLTSVAMLTFGIVSDSWADLGAPYQYTKSCGTAYRGVCTVCLYNSDGYVTGCKFSYADRPQNCSDYTCGEESCTCNKCQSGTSFNNSGKCTSCGTGVDSCTFDDSGTPTAKACKSGYTFIAADSSCLKCPSGSSYCTTNNDGETVACPGSVPCYMDGKGNLKRAPYEYTQSCGNAYRGVCTVCLYNSDGYVTGCKFSYDDGSQNCSDYTCGEESCTCNKCQSGTSFNNSGRCTSCGTGVDSCTFDDSGTPTAKTCKGGYAFSTADSSCLKCPNNSNYCTINDAGQTVACPSGVAECHFDMLGNLIADKCSSGVLCGGSCYLSGICTNNQIDTTTDCTELFSGCRACTYDEDKNRAVCSYCKVGGAPKDGICPPSVGAKNKLPWGDLCVPGTYKDSSGNCIEGTIANCANYSSDGTTCTKCFDNYTLEDNKCTCPGNDCPTEADCAEGEFLGVGDYSTSTTRSCRAKPSNCQKLTNIQGNFSYCETCHNGYYMNTLYQCVDEDGCGVNMYADSKTGRCEKKPDGCRNVDTNGKCDAHDELCWGGYLEKDGDCISASQGCGAGYKDMGGFCNRIQYTPAEAAAILNDDNNSVTITFKK